MAQKPALEEGQLHSKNFRSIRDWIEANKAKIKAKPTKSVLYSGRDYDVNLELNKEDEEEYRGTPMFKRLEQMRKTMQDQNVPCDFETLEDVLKTIRDYPEVVDKNHLSQHFDNAFVFFDSLSKLKSLDALVPNRRKAQDDCWKRLSEIYASNAIGDLKFLTGVADDYSILKADKAFIQKELAALLKNNKLSQAAKDQLEKKMSEFGRHFDRRYTKMISQLAQGKATLTKKQH
jgi:hypothetical protein